jgi:hypothetical protein
VRIRKEVDLLVVRIAQFRERLLADAGPRGGGTGAVTYIDTNSAEVQQLKSAALPLIMRLNDEQKREVKSMAYVMGLESVASLF